MFSPQVTQIASGCLSETSLCRAEREPEGRRLHERKKTIHPKIDLNHRATLSASVNEWDSTNEQEHPQHKPEEDLSVTNCSGALGYICNTHKKIHALWGRFPYLCQFVWGVCAAPLGEPRGAEGALRQKESTPSLNISGSKFHPRLHRGQLTPSGALLCSAPGDRSDAQFSPLLQRKSR